MSSPRGPWELIRDLSSGQRVLALDVTGASDDDVEALLGDTACVIHATPDQVRSMDERFAMSIVQLGRGVHSLRSAVDSLRQGLVSDGVAILVWEAAALTAEALVDVVRVIHSSFVASYVVADRTLWVSKGAPILREMTQAQGGSFLAIASDAMWRLLEVASAGTPPEEMKPIFQLVQEQAIHLAGREALLSSFEQRLGRQEQELAEAHLLARATAVESAELRERGSELQRRLADLDESLATARADCQAAELSNAVLTTELETWRLRYEAVVGSAGWMLLERLRSVVRRLRR